MPELGGKQLRDEDDFQMQMLVASIWRISEC